MRHWHSVEGQRPPRAVHRRPDKYTNLFGGNTNMTSTLDIKTGPLPNTTMLLPHTKLPIPTITSAKTARTQGAGGYGGTMTKYLGKSRKPRTAYTRTPTTVV